MGSAQERGTLARGKGCARDVGGGWGHPRAFGLPKVAPEEPKADFVAT